MHLSFKSVCNKEHKGVICNTTSSSYSSQSTRPTVGRVLWEELLVLFKISQTPKDRFSRDEAHIIKGGSGKATHANNNQTAPSGVYYTVC